MNWASKSANYGATLSSICDNTYAAGSGITAQRSFGLSLTDEMNALSISECWMGFELQTYMSHRACALSDSKVMYIAHHGSTDASCSDTLQDGESAIYLASGSGSFNIYQAKRRGWSANDVRYSWTDLAEMRWQRDWFRNASYNVRSWVAYLNDYVSRVWYGREDIWTREFLKLDPRVLEKDDWTLSFKYSGFSRPELIPVIRGCLPDFRQHFEKVADLLHDLRQLLAKVEGIKSHFDWLCQLGASLLVFFYRCCSLFLSQRSWFLHHSAHPPHARISYLPGFGGAGALLQLSS